jgi:hypothetical protein
MLMLLEIIGQVVCLARLVWPVLALKCGPGHAARSLNPARSYPSPKILMGFYSKTECRPGNSVIRAVLRTYCTVQHCNNKKARENK